MQTERVRTQSAAETVEVGARLGELVAPGDLVILAGDLGAGKTTLARGIARAAGYPGLVTSPTFVLVHEYEGRIPIVHVDAYRLERVQELHELGIDDYLDGQSVVLVEWGDVVAEALPPDRLDVRIELGEGPDERLVEIVVHGAAWQARAAALHRALHEEG